MGTTRTTPLVNAAVRIDSLNAVGVVVALGDHGTAWVRLADGTEEQFLIEDLTVIAPGVRRPAAVATLPATPRKLVLTPGQKRILATDELHSIDGLNSRNADIFLPSHRAVFTEDCDALVTLGLLQRHGDDITPHKYRYTITENGESMRTWLRHQNHLAMLARQVKAEGIDGEDLTDLAAGIDAGEETGTITGTSIDFQLAFALAASLTDQSAEDLRAELETYMGWRD